MTLLEMRVLNDKIWLTSYVTFATNYSTDYVDTFFIWKKKSPNVHVFGFNVLCHFQHQSVQ